MRNLLVAICLVVGLGTVVVFQFPWLTPWTSERDLERDCGQTQPDDGCVVRMREMGDIWSSLGNLERAERWYYQAARQNDVVAMFELGWISEARAIEMVKSARQLNEPWGEDSGDDGETQTVVSARADDPVIVANLDRSIAWYRAAADKGFAPAMNNLGQLYLLGLGRAPDMQAAFQWHLAAARAGNPVALWNVQITYAGGHGVQRDADLANKWATWNPSVTDARDLRWPVLERTTLFGSPVSRGDLGMLRSSWKAGAPVRLQVSALPPDPSLTVYDRVAEVSE